MEFEDSIYEASPEAILKAVRATDPAIKTLLVVGHNPGMQQLAGTLIALGRHRSPAAPARGIPHRSHRHDQLCGAGLESLHANGGRLEHFVTPQTLEAATD